MALFFHESDDANAYRQTGFARYRQLLSFYAFRWLRVNLLTVAGALPLAAGITYAILSSSLLLLIPFSIAGGLILGPFLAAMYDSILRGLRDAPGRFGELYKKSWKNNARQSLLPGAITGLFTGILVFAVYVLWSRTTFAGWGTILLILFAALLFVSLQSLYWPQLVLFSQSNLIRLKNCVLFGAMHLWKVLGTSALILLYVAIIVLFAPWTLILIPFLGFWYILFLTQLILYADMDAAYRIEEQFQEIEGDPWRVSEWDGPSEP